MGTALAIADLQSNQYQVLGTLYSGKRCGLAKSQVLSLKNPYDRLGFILIQKYVYNSM